MNCFTPEMGKRLASYYLHNRHDYLLDAMSLILEKFEAQTKSDSIPDTRSEINHFMAHFFYYFIQPDLVITGREQIQHWLGWNHILSLLCAISHLKSADAYIRILLTQPDTRSRNVKLLTLYSPFNHQRPDYQWIFSTMPDLANSWYIAYLTEADYKLANSQSEANLCRHFEFDGGRYYCPNRGYQVVYFLPNYLRQGLDRIVRRRLNHYLGKQSDKIAKAQPRELRRTGKKEIAIFSMHWVATNSIYKTQAGFIRALSEDYRLTLIRPNARRNSEEDHASFAEVMTQEKQDYHALLSDKFIAEIRKKNFAAIYQPATGLDQWSIQLANQELAPIQATSVGHPVSTHGSKINVYFTGDEVENQSLLKQHYSEHLVLLPGYGLVYEPLKPITTHPTADRDRVIVCCCWTPQKINTAMLKLLQRIVQLSHCEITIKIFTSDAPNLLRNLVLRQQIEQIITSSTVEVIPHIPHKDYMQAMMDADLCLESFPFGSSNVMTEYLHLGKPVVSFCGDLFYNRIGASILRRVGLADLITDNAEDYVRLAVRLIDNRPLRRQIAARVAAIDKNLITDDRSSSAFKIAFDYLLDHPEKFSLQQPQQLLQFNSAQNLIHDLLN